MLTPSLISAQNSTISAQDKELWLLYLDQNPIYRSHALLVGDDAETKIDAINGTTKAKQLNALMFLINELGSGVVEIRGDRDGLWWWQAREREALINQAFYVLYNSTSDDPTNGNGDSTGIVPQLGLWGSYAAVGQRPQYTSIEGGTRDCFIKPRRFR